MKKVFIPAAAAPPIVLASCKKSEKDPIENAPPSILEPRFTIMAQPNHIWGSEPFVMGQNNSVNGTDIQIDEVMFYLSNFSAISLQGDSVALRGLILVDASTDDMLMIAHSDETFIYDFKFYLGLDYDTSHAALKLANAPMNDPCMHWVWNINAGYKFLKTEGKSDVDGNGNFEPFRIHAAKDASSRTIIQTVILDLTERSNTVHMDIDYQSALAEVDFTGHSVIQGASNLAKSIADAFGTSVLDFK